MKKDPTPEEALVIVLHQRAIREKWRSNPKNRERARGHQREYNKRLKAGYLAAKKAGLI